MQSCTKNSIRASIGNTEGCVPICFVDFQKAFDTVKHEQMIEMLGEVGVDSKDLRLITILYYRTASDGAGGWQLNGLDRDRERCQARMCNVTWLLLIVRAKDHGWLKKSRAHKYRRKEYKQHIIRRWYGLDCGLLKETQQLMNSLNEQ